MLFLVAAVYRPVRCGYWPHAACPDLLTGAHWPPQAAAASPIGRSVVVPVGSMGRTCFARGPCAARGRTAKLGPKSMALQRTTLRTPHPTQTGPPHRAVGWRTSWERWLAGGASSEPSSCGGLDGANLFCAGPLRQSWQDRKAGAEEHGPVRAERYDCRSPTQNKSAPSSLWVGGFLGAVAGLAGLARWVGLAGLGRGGAVGSMGRTCFARGPCTSRRRTAKAGAEKHGPAARQGYDCRSPTQNKSAPSSSWHLGFRVSSGWLERSWPSALRSGRPSSPHRVRPTNTPLTGAAAATARHLWPLPAPLPPVACAPALGQLLPVVPPSRPASRSPAADSSAEARGLDRLMLCGLWQHR
ncbi:hypothetical protein JOD54_004129 [Actinokineospora baliensis]|nr:hypothetical protein [Actinokineospora baliensis]